MAAIIAVPNSSTFAQAAAPAAKPAAPATAKQPAAPPKPVTEVKKEDFRVDVTLPAVFEGIRLTPISIEPKEWADLTIETVVPHGTRVKKGDRLVELDLKALEEQVSALDAAAKSAKITLQSAIDGLANMEKISPLELEAAHRGKKIADETFDLWIKQGRDREYDAVKRSYEAAERQLEYAQEELNQLQKMYDEDDLTEETEEIILKRAKIGVEQGEYYLKRAAESRDFATKFGIPRAHQDQVNAHKQAGLAHAINIRNIPSALALKRLEIVKAKEDAQKSNKKLADLRRDLAVLADIKAPADGIIYYGESVLGNWTSAAEAKKLIKGGKIAAKSTFMTLVGEGGLRVQTSIPEDKLAILKAGAKGRLTPVSNPLLSLPVVLGKINYATSPLGFSTSAKVDAPEGANLFPGMKANLRFNIADRKGVLTVPVSAISREGDKHFVHLAKEDADAEKREVKLGETDGKKIVVLKGLGENDKVLTVAP